MKIIHDAWSTEDMKKLREKAAEGSIEAKIELAALEIEDAQNVEANLAFLEEQAEQKNTLALMRLHFIFSEDTTRTEADGSKTVLIAEDQDKAYGYLSRAAELGSAWAMEGMGIREKLKVVASDENDVTEQAFLDREKWFLAALKAAQKPESDLAPSGMETLMRELSFLYEDDNPKNPLHNAEKAAEWKAKAAEFANAQEQKA